MGIKQFAPGLDIQTEIEEIIEESKLTKKMIEIKDHFQEYNYIYIPIILSITGLLMTIMMLIACCFQQYKRTRKTTRKRSNRTKPQIMPRNPETTLQLKQLPFRPGWEIQEV